MIGSSEAYTRFKSSMAQQLDFVVLVSYAVPLLKRAIDAKPSSSSPVPLQPPDHFRNRILSETQLLLFTREYQKDLARSLVLSGFSYFEAYIKALVREFIEFHGGPSKLLATAVRRSQKSLRTSQPELVRAKRKLQDRDDQDKADKFRKNAAILTRLQMRFPSELLSPYGVARLIEKVGKDRRLEMRAGEIPDLLLSAFHVDAFAPHVETFKKLRLLRNEIAHGQRKHVDLAEAIETGKVLRRCAALIDKHFMEHFFVIERYAP